jgi:hypothetical protein
VDVHEIPARRNEPAHHHFDVRFLLTTVSEIDRAATDDPTRPIEWRTAGEALSEGVDASLERALGKATAWARESRTPRGAAAGSGSSAPSRG